MIQKLSYREIIPPGLAPEDRGRAIRRMADSAIYALDHQGPAVDWSTFSLIVRAERMTGFESAVLVLHAQATGEDPS